MRAASAAQPPRISRTGAPLWWQLKLAYHFWRMRGWRLPTDLGPRPIMVPFLARGRPSSPSAKEATVPFAQKKQSSASGMHPDGGRDVPSPWGAIGILHIKGIEWVALRLT
jgi:hypothetical protein